MRPIVSMLASFIAFFVAALLVLFPYSLGRAFGFGFEGPDAPGLLRLCAPIALSGYFIDWCRLRRPSVPQVVSAVVLFVFANVLVHSARDTQLDAWLVAFGVLVSATLLALPILYAKRTHRVAVFIGLTPSGTYRFMCGDECLELSAHTPPQLMRGVRYALRFDGAHEDQESGPYRGRRRIVGRLREVAPSSKMLGEETREKARWYGWAGARALAYAAVLIGLTQLMDPEPEACSATLADNTGQKPWQA